VDAVKSVSLSDPGFSKTVLDAAQTGRQTLQLMQAMAKSHANESDKMNQLAKRRVSLIDARNKLLTEDRMRQAAERLRQ
jgi:hypothetical protein